MIKHMARPLRILDNHVNLYWIKGGYIEVIVCRFNRSNPFQLYSLCDVRWVSGNEMALGYLFTFAYRCLGGSY